MRNIIVALIICSMSAFYACSAKKDYLVTLETRHGNIYVILYDETPVHKENFLKLAREGRFDSTTFHRIIKDFMVQGGDVFAKEGMAADEWYTLPAELNKGYIHEQGSIAAARQGDAINPDKRSSGCQFYIVQGKVFDRMELTTDMMKLQESFQKFLQLERNKSLKDQYEELYLAGDFGGINQLALGYKEELESFFNVNLTKNLSKEQLEAYTTVGGTPHLDGEYTVFGKVIQGMEVVDKIANEETSHQDVPISPVYMTVSVEKLSKDEIAETYGYEYPL